MENKLNLPANFETYPDARKAGFMRMKELKDNGTYDNGFKLFHIYLFFLLININMASAMKSAGMIPIKIIDHALTSLSVMSRS